MTKKVYYEKKGRRYVPVQEYDGDFMDSYSKGTHLLMVYPGGQSRRYNIDPNYAALIAAGRVAEDAICRAISKASEMRPQRTPITPGQKKAWEKLAKELGDELCPLTYGSEIMLKPGSKPCRWRQTSFCNTKVFERPTIISS